MNCPNCGNDRFYAHQVQYWDVIVDGDGEWQEDISSDEADAPYGPYICTECGSEVDEL